ncbi:hypothetical protein [Rhizobium lentis]|uniref:Uncharacterized protein n=1 Tax=Rhizobium lentis TaxID=1138194 RepID=A0A7W8XEE7_9HYPH|nr:hypothetical protein [Rhizobium lentis]MBB4574429.1 hypothetical protein [Rhizobium lentis]MBB5550355.1 hypothetical protein [Rhizobium lentis]MBB5560616.1 hypothetical protein [Rhizobium lentis]MBB5567201.1 hypothetical protein [Rhizobium lentis]
MATSALARQPAAGADPSTLFSAALSLLHVRMPLRHDATHCGTIVGADGNPVFVVDMNRERPDAEVTDIAELLLLAINVHAGYLPEGGRADG